MHVCMYACMYRICPQWFQACTSCRIEEVDPTNLSGALSAHPSLFPSLPPLPPLPPSLPSLPPTVRAWRWDQTSIGMAGAVDVFF